MIHPDEALAIIDAIKIRALGETVGIGEALGRVPLVDPVSRVDQPPFDKATMDGFAYARADGGLAQAGETFRVVASTAAGERAAPRLKPGECARIMTGAPVPNGAVAVHRLERVSESEGMIVISRVEEDANIVRRAANRRAGERLFERRPLKPQDVGLLAANGIAALKVARRPVVRVISTGDELVAAESVASAATASAAPSLGPGMIYDSNGPQLVAQARACGCDAAFEGIAPDDEDELATAIERAADVAELVVVSGGVSAGDRDYTPSAAARAGFEELFHGIAMKPGKPAYLGRRGQVFLYGVPGNPVAAFVNFEVMLRPLIMRLCGAPHRPIALRVRMGEAASRRELERVEYLPVELRGALAFPLRYTGSTMLDVLALADALIRLDIGVARVEAGEEIDARLV